MLFHRTTVTNLNANDFGDSRIFTGPLWNSLDWDCNARLWGGTVLVAGNIVSYRNLHADDSVVVDADFEVRPDGMDVHLAQRIHSDRETLECEAWRFVWNGKTAAVATLGIPRQDAGASRRGRVAGDLGAPGYGNLSCEQKSGDAARLQVDSLRQCEIGWAGIVFGQPTSYPQQLHSRTTAARGAI